MTYYPVPIPDTITSAANDEVKRLRALHERKFRKQTGWFLAEGVRICHEAVELGWIMHRLAFVAGREDDHQVKRLLAGLARAKGRALPMTPSLLQRISRKENPQMVLGAFEQRWIDFGHVSSFLTSTSVSYTHLRAHETLRYLVCRLLLEKKKK